MERLTYFKDGLTLTVFSSAISAIWRLRRKIFAATENGWKNDGH